MQIRDSVFIVTGAASGLGAAVAHMLAAGGARLVLADRQIVPGQALAEQLGGRFVECDVTSEADAARAVQAAGELGALRGLVNCAGMAPACTTVGRDGAHPLALFERTVHVNLTGSFNMARLAAEAMAGLAPTAEGERGIIIHTASVAGYEGQIGQVAYAASKAAIIGMTLPMARDLARHGIRVMTIAPGVFETPLLGAMPREVQDGLGRAVPFPSRLGRPQEFAQLACAIIENVMLNGETIRLDGAIRLAPK
ncbi:MAG: SDR family NAD(P)-dependent oxidoreductase [Janthinobacterium lividum]